MAMRLEPKLVASYLLVGIIPFALVSILALFITSEALTELTKHHMTSVVQLKRAQAEALLQKTRNDIRALSINDAVLEAYEQLRLYHVRMHTKPHEAYDVSTPEYRQLWKQYGEPIARMAKSLGYDELYMICKPHGHVMYTAQRKDDLGTNLRYGPYQNSPLAELWKKAAATDAVAVVDFSPYEPNDGAHTGFMAAPIRDVENKVLGLVAFQIPVASVQILADERSGLGDTGDSFIVGKVDGQSTLRTTIPMHTIDDPSIKMGYEKIGKPPALPGWQ